MQEGAREAASKRGDKNKSIHTDSSVGSGEVEEVDEVDRREEEQSGAAAPLTSPALLVDEVLLSEPMDPSSQEGRVPCPYLLFLGWNGTGLRKLRANLISALAVRGELPM